MRHGFLSQSPAGWRGKVKNPSVPGLAELIRAPVGLTLTRPFLSFSPVKDKWENTKQPTAQDGNYRTRLQPALPGIDTAQMQPVIDTSVGSTCTGHRNGLPDHHRHTRAPPVINCQANQVEQHNGTPPPNRRMGNAFCFTTARMPDHCQLTTPQRRWEIESGVSHVPSLDRPRRIAASSEGAAWQSRDIAHFVLVAPMHPRSKRAQSPQRQAI